MININGKSSIIMYSLILFFVSVIPYLDKPYFLHSAGSIQIIGPQIGFFLALGIYLKWKYIDRIFYVVIVPVIIIDIFTVFMTDKEFVFNLILLLACHIGLLVVFKFSKYIQSYLKSDYKY